MVKAGLLACSVLLASACGGKSGKSTDDAQGTAGMSGTASSITGGGAGVAGGGGMPEPTCVSTPRSTEEDAGNAAVVDMAAHAEPDKLVPLIISLVEVPVSPGVNAAERAAQLEPYQGPIATQLEEWGAQGIERFWLTNGLAASVPAKYVAQVLCLANVRLLESNAPYWEVVDRPWGPDEAGEIECPLSGNECPAHCFDFYGMPWDSAAGCFSRRERVACVITQGLINDGGSTCLENVASGQPYLFYGFAPLEPYLLGWRPCSPEREPTTCSL